MDQKEIKSVTRRKTGKGEKGKGKGKGKKKSVMRARLEEEMGPRSEEIPEIGANTSYRHINLANVIGGNGWGSKNWEKECSSIIDTGFNGGLRSFSWLNRYGEYLGSFYPTSICLKIMKTNKFVFGNPHGRVSVKSTVLPIWSTDSFRPARLRLIDGMTELLLRLDIVRKLDITVVFGSDHFRVGQGELEMMTYNEKHRWVCHLVPTACDYAKLNDYFWKMQNGQIDVSQVQ